MREVRACAACLATDERMHSMGAGGLLQAYEILVGVLEADAMPQWLCWVCGAMLHKFLRFRGRCHRAHHLLRDIYIQCDELTLELVKSIDRNGNDANLSSPYTISAVHSLTIDSEVASISELTPKHSQDSIDNADYFVEVDKGEIMGIDDIKSEMPDIEFVDDVSAPRLTDSDDDKPLRLLNEDIPVKKRKKRKLNAEGKCKKLKTENFKDEVVKESTEEIASSYIEELMTKEEQLEAVRMRQHSSAYRKARYKCGVCYKSYPRRDRYDQHMRLHDPESGALECEICKVRMPSGDVLAEHVKKNHTKKYTCTRCNHVSINQNTAALHARSHEAAEVRRTTVLDKLQATAVKLTKEEQLRVFQERQHSEEYRLAKFKCRVCYHVSGRKEAYERHKRKHDPLTSGSVECDICRQTFKTRQAVTVHQMKCHAKKYQCHLCSNVCYSLKEAKSHREWHAGGCKARRGRVKRETPEHGGELVETMSVEGLTQEQQMNFFLTSRESDAPYKCHVCLKGHYDAKAFSNHLLKHEPVSGKFQCDICKYRYKSRYHIQRHIVYFHKNQYRCKICGELFHNRMAATKHHLWHKGKVYECPHCGLQSNILSSHLTHLRLKHPSDYVCGACGEAFVSQLGLQQHNRITHALQPKPDAPAEEAPEPAAGPYCGACDVQFASAAAWTRHILISPKHEHEKHSVVNGCRECGARYSSAAELKAHRRAAHPPRFQRPRARDAARRQPRPCAQCGETMESPREYWTHFRRVHPGETYPLEVPMSHICEHCGKGFRCNALLAIHRHVHTGTRNYACSLCPKSFFNPLNLKNHLVSHSERRPHACRLCRKAFKFKSALERHMRTHTGVKPYACEVCSKAFSDSSSCRLHVRTVHLKEPTPYTHTGEKPYACEVCDKTFSTSSSGRLHVRTVHRREPAPHVSKARLDRARARTEPAWPEG